MKAHVLFLKHSLIIVKENKFNNTQDITTR